MCVVSMYMLVQIVLPVDKRPLGNMIPISFMLMNHSSLKCVWKYVKIFWQSLSTFTLSKALSKVRFLRVKIENKYSLLCQESRWSLNLIPIRSENYTFQSVIFECVKIERVCMMRSTLNSIINFNQRDKNKSFIS